MRCSCGGGWAAFTRELYRDGHAPSQVLLPVAREDGTRAVVLEPLDLIARICALIPAPRVNMVRYHGVLSSRSSLRKEKEVVPVPPAAVVNPLLDDDAQLALQFEQPGMSLGSGHCGEGADEVPLCAL